MRINTIVDDVCAVFCRFLRYQNIKIGFKSYDLDFDLNHDFGCDLNHLLNSTRDQPRGLVPETRLDNFENCKFLDVPITESIIIYKYLFKSKICFYHVFDMNISKYSFR